MSAISLISILLLAPPAESSSTETVPVTGQPAVESSAAQTLTVEELRTAFLHVMQRSAKRLNPDPAELVPQLAAVYVALERAEGFSQRERVHMRESVKARLEQFRDRLLRDQLRESRAARPTPVAANLRSDPKRTESLAGGAAAANANDLIDLIQTVIAPEHWDVNGGPGSIYYFPMVQALVVRARGDVHEQIGGVLGQVRRLNQ